MTDSTTVPRGTFAEYWAGPGQSYRSALTGLANTEAVESMLREAFNAGVKGAALSAEDRHIDGIREAFHTYHGSDPAEWDFDGAHVRVIEDFMSDGPGWCGDVAIVIGGEISFITILTRSGGSDKFTGGWKVEHFINEGVVSGATQEAA